MDIMKQIDTTSVIEKASTTLTYKHKKTVPTENVEVLTPDVKIEDPIELPDYVVLNDDDTDVGIGDLIRQQDKILNDVARVQMKMSRKLEAAIDNMDLDLNEMDADAIMKKMVAVKTQLDIQSSRTKNFSERINSRLRNKDPNRDGSIGKVVAEVLNNLSVKSIAFRPREDAQYELTVSQDELKELESFATPEEMHVCDIEIREKSDDYS